MRISALFFVFGLLPFAAQAADMTAADVQAVLDASKAGIQVETCTLTNEGADCTLANGKLAITVDGDMAFPLPPQAGPGALNGPTMAVLNPNANEAQVMSLDDHGMTEYMATFRWKIAQ